MSPVDFKKWPCRPVEFRGQGPPFYPNLISALRLGIRIIARQSSDLRLRLELKQMGGSKVRVKGQRPGL